MIWAPVFMYHRVSDLPSPSSQNMQVSPDKFEQQMYFLFQKGFRCLSLSEAIINWQQGNPQPERSFVITFDDGYIDNYMYAYPVLKKYGFTATIFVVAQAVEDGNTRYLSWEHMRELAQNNINFGSHSMNHPRLLSLDDKTIKYELDESKKIIEDQLRHPVVLLAYPYGESNERIQEMAAEVGYEAACGANRGQLLTYNLWRVPISENENKLSLYWKANGSYYIYTWLIEATHLDRKMKTLKHYVRRI